MVNLPLSAAGRSYAKLTVRRSPLSLPARMPRESRRVAASSSGILRGVVAGKQQRATERVEAVRAQLQANQRIN
jgi:hypothetical protein